MKAKARKMPKIVVVPSRDTQDAQSVEWRQFYESRGYSVTFETTRDALGTLYFMRFTLP